MNQPSYSALEIFHNAILELDRKFERLTPEQRRLAGDLAKNCASNNCPWWAFQAAVWWFLSSPASRFTLSGRRAAEANFGQPATPAPVTICNRAESDLWREVFARTNDEFKADAALRLFQARCKNTLNPSE